MPDERFLPLGLSRRPLLVGRRDSGGVALANPALERAELWELTSEPELGEKNKRLKMKRVAERGRDFGREGSSCGVQKGMI